jgi:hypothetical protein
MLLLEMPERLKNNSTESTTFPITSPIIGVRQSF